MRKRIVSAALLAATLAGCGPAITEDDPRWDCRTMGNLICGPASVDHEPGRYADGVLVEHWHDGMYGSPSLAHSDSGGWEMG
jgi:hypothetical protein